MDGAFWGAREQPRFIADSGGSACSKNFTNIPGLVPLGSPARYDELTAV